MTIQSRTRLQIRQSIGYLLNAIIVGAASSTSDTSSLIDTYGLAKGGDDEYNGSQVQINVPAGSIVAGEKSWVSDFNSTNKDATVSPVFTAALSTGDTYEMWLAKKGYTIEQANDAINQAFFEATKEILIDKVDTTLVREADKYEYPTPTGFVAIHTVEYVYDVKTDTQLEACDVVWDELVGTGVTASIDTSIEKEGSGCLKLVIGATASANEILATQNITSVNLSGYDEVIAWIYSTTALTAGDMKILLDSTAACAGTPAESLSIPAIAAYTMTPVAISLANPSSDSAIISVGIKLITDRAFTFYVDDIRAQNSKSRIYHEINPEFWYIVQASTNLLKLTEAGYALCAENERLRLHGYAIPTLLSADSTASELDPDYVIASAMARLLMSGAGGGQVDPEERFRQAQYWKAEAQRLKLQNRTRLQMNTRFIS